MNTKKLFDSILRPGVAFLVVISCMLALKPADVRASGAIYRVTPGGVAAGGCGASWTTNPCSLQYALGVAVNGDEIWVEAGTYKPAAPGGDRNATFQLKTGVGVYGGFEGSETTREQRNWVTHVVTLSGDLNGDDAGFTNNGENSYHVVTGVDNAALDGVNVTGGNANGDYPAGLGGGMFNDGASPVVANVSFSGNTAFWGGGMENDYFSSPTLTNTTFSGNTAVIEGGGMESDNSNPTLTNTTFSGNTASDGGGMFNYYSSPTLINTTFSGNTATYGGGMANDYFSSPTLTNITFSGNTATYGGGMANYFSNNPAVRNSILWGDSGGEIYINDSTSTVTVSYSDAQGGYAGAGNIDTDPLFVTAVPTAPTTSGNLHLRPGSPAIDAGDNSVVSATTDRDGHARISGARVDMGAYESQTIYRVTTGGVAAGGCGASWTTNPCSLQYALGVAVNGDEIWVEAGTYKPAAPGGDRNATFQLKTGVGIYGGFGGSETTREQRNWVTHVVTLSGDLNGDDSGFTNNGENSIHVVMGADNATLDGMNVTGGNANGGSDPADLGGGMYNNGASPVVANVSFSGNTATFGGGMYNYYSSPTLTNTTFNGNTASYAGGGMESDNSSPTLTNTTFSGNTATYDGGGMENWYSSSTLTNTTFSGNTAATGGGMENYESSPTLTNTTFSGNTATSYGGGMENWYSSPTLTNTIFCGNTADSYGGGMYNDDSSPTLTNTTFSGNTAEYAGGGMENENSSSPTVRNSILWGDSGGEIDDDSNSTVTLSYSDVQGGYTGTGNINADPLFVTAVPTAPTAGGDLHLRPGSPAIDAGDNSVVTAATDRDGHARIFGTRVDMGAYEWRLIYVKIFLPLLRK